MLHLFFLLKKERDVGCFVFTLSNTYVYFGESYMILGAGKLKGRPCCIKGNSVVVQSISIVL